MYVHAENKSRYTSYSNVSCLPVKLSTKSVQFRVSLECLIYIHLLGSRTHFKYYTRVNSWQSDNQNCETLAD
jgi:outer membrane phospholipase A